MPITNDDLADIVNLLGQIAEKSKTLLGAAERLGQRSGRPMPSIGDRVASNPGVLEPMPHSDKDTAGALRELEKATQEVGRQELGRQAYCVTTRRP